jgi:hypothetical protein
VWTVNATDVEWVECEHVNKTGLMLQLETQIYDVTSQLHLAKKKSTPQTSPIQPRTIEEKIVGQNEKPEIQT